MKYWHALTFAVLVGTLVGPVCAQTPSGSLSGEVHDGAGGAVVNAVVTARNTGTNLTRSVITNATGSYQITPLLPGEYQISVEAAGFRKEVKTGVTLQVASEARLDFALQIGQVNETVNVEASAELTQTDTSSVGTVIDNRKVVELPLNSREFYGLALLSPGAYQPAQGSTLGFRGGFNVSGASEISNNFTVNGIDNNDQGTNAPAFRPSVDAIQEFKLLTGTYAAEYGRSTGAQVVVITKSGSNQFHGGLFEFFRNQKMDAQKFLYAPRQRTCL